MINQACWPNGKALDYESRDCRFDPCVGHILKPLNYYEMVRLKILVLKRWIDGGVAPTRFAAVKTQWGRSLRFCFIALINLSSRSSSWFNCLQVYLERARSGDVGMNISRQGLHLVHDYDCGWK